MNKQITMQNQTEFLLWMDKVDVWCQKLSGVSIYDLADQPFSDMFEDGRKPKAAAKLALRSDGF